MITFRQKGDFSNLSGFLERAKETVNLGILNKSVYHRGDGFKR